MSLGLDAVKTSESVSCLASLTTLTISFRRWIPQDRAIGRFPPTNCEPSTDAGTYPRQSWWVSDRSKQVIQALQWLNHGNRNLPGNSRFFTLEERSTDEWNAHFVDTLRLIEGWKEIEEPSSEEWFGMVSEAYELIAELTPPGRQRDAVMTRYLTFMDTHYAGSASQSLVHTVEEPVALKRPVGRRTVHQHVEPGDVAVRESEPANHGVGLRNRQRFLHLCSPSITPD
jgi:hypothetical protein